MEKSDLKLLYLVMVETDPDHILFLSNRRRTRPVVERKQMFAAVARNHGASYNDIANFVGWKTHTTAIWAVKTIHGYMEFYLKTKLDYEMLSKAFLHALTMKNG